MSADEDDVADRDFERRARAGLCREPGQTPADVQAGLDRIVDRALREPPAARTFGFAVPAGAVAVLAGFFIMQQWRAPDGPPRAAPVPDDFALLIDGDNLDLLEQMEFYQWLERQPDTLAEDASDSAQRS